MERLVLEEDLSSFDCSFSSGFCVLLSSWDASLADTPSGGDEVVDDDSGFFE